MRTFISPETRFDFMGARKKAFIFSATLTVLTLILLFTKGLNKGIEFAGGSSAIIAFDRNAVPEREAISGSIGKVLTERLNKADSTISVQDFGAGAGDSIDDKLVTRFLVYTEATTLVDTAARERINAALTSAFSADGGVRVATSEDAGDTLYLTFGTDRDIVATKAKLKEILAGLQFEKVSITSDLERQVEVEFLRDVDLQQQDTARDGTANPYQLSEADKQRRLDEAVVGKTDKRFTIDIEALSAAFEVQLKADFPTAFIAVESSAMVSPSVGADLFNDGMLALLYSLIGILIYVTLRFDFRYAPGGVASLLHDGLVMLGFVVVTDMKFSLSILAGILTVVGYSINDTIVVSDRIRELYTGQKGKALVELLNKALNQTLSRTLLTAFTTLIAILSILIFGGDQVRDFAIVMFVGVAFGIYSSIYIAIPFVPYLDNYFDRIEADRAAAKKTAQGNNNIKKADPADDKKSKATV